MARWPSFLPVRLLLWFSLTWAQSGTQSKISKETKEISVLPWMFCVKVNRNWNNAEKSVDNVNLLSFIEDKRNRPTGNGWSSSSLRLFFCFFFFLLLFCLFARLLPTKHAGERFGGFGRILIIFLFYFSEMSSFHRAPKSSSNVVVCRVHHTNGHTTAACFSMRR